MLKTISKAFLRTTNKEKEEELIRHLRKALKKKHTVILIAGWNKVFKKKVKMDGTGYIKNVTPHQVAGVADAVVLDALNQPSEVLI